MEVFADALYVLHIVIVAAVVSPLFLPAGEWLKYPIILVCLILLDWHLPDGDGGCSVTDLESKLRGEWRGHNVPKDERPQFMNPFLNMLLRPVGIQLTVPESDALNYLAFVGCLLFGFIRFCAFEKTPVRFKGGWGRAWAVGIGCILALNLVNQLWKPEARRKDIAST